MQGLRDITLKDRRVLLRCDLNVPISNGRITHDRRIQAALPTIRYILQCNPKQLLILSHLGRPQHPITAETQKVLSLEPIANYISTALGQPIKLIKRWLSLGISPESAPLVMLENIRFEAGETHADESLSRELAQLCDVFVMDAFATAHRNHASTTGVARYAPQVASGLLVERELKTLQQCLHSPTKPLLAIIGGSKVNSKMVALDHLSQYVDAIAVGGAVANTFLAALGFEVGQSLYSPDCIEVARKLMEKVQVIVPEDVIVQRDKDVMRLLTNEVVASDSIMDIGHQTAKKLAKQIAQAGTLIWSGAPGKFEVPEFASGTRKLVDLTMNSQAYSLVGGGDTLAAISKFGELEAISYASTGGGAFLQCLAGEPLIALNPPT